MTAERIGLEKVRDLKPGQEVWDSVVPGFIARRQKGESDRPPRGGPISMLV